MRLDLFLKLSRLCPRRTLAQQLCDAGLVLLNDRPAKSAHNVKTGDAIAVKRRDRETIVRVLKVPDKPNVSRQDAKELIEVVSDEKFESLDL
jgi:ribosomal 50S subunit-recycling heat shock protein